MRVIQNREQDLHRTRQQWIVEALFFISFIVLHKTFVLFQDWNGGLWVPINNNANISTGYSM